MDDLTGGRGPSPHDGISRRRMMALMGQGGLGLAAMGSATIWGGAALAQDGTPQRGGVLTMNLTSDPADFDPMATTTNRVLYIASACYNQLIQFDPMQPEVITGDLARAWTVSEDGLTYTFDLIPGVLFHDGRPFTSADVKYTFDFMMNPPEGAVIMRTGPLEVVDGIAAPDDLTVVFTLKRPSPAFLSVLASGWMLIYPRHILEAKGHMKEDVVGTGPFKLSSYDRGVRIDLVRNDAYHIPDRPYLDGITVFIVDDPMTALAYLETGQLLLYINMGDEEARRARSMETVVVQDVPALSFNCIIFNTKTGPFTDLRVRQAASLAIDRQEAINVVGLGEAVVGGLMPPGQWALPAERLAAIPGYAGDAAANQARARELLAEAGYPDGFDTVLMSKNNVSSETLSVYVQAKLAEIGIRSTLDLQEDAVSQESLLNGAFEISPWVHSAGGNDPDQIYSDFYTCDAARNFTGNCDAGFDAEFEAQSAEMDPAARLETSYRMEEAMLGQFNRAILFWQKKFLGLSPRVQNLIIHPVMDNNRRFQDVWLSA